MCALLSDMLRAKLESLASYKTTKIEYIYIMRYVDWKNYFYLSSAPMLEINPFFAIVVYLFSYYENIVDI